MPEHDDTRARRERLERLEKECEAIYDALLLRPSDSALYRRLSEVEIQIVRLTGESALYLGDYLTGGTWSSGQKINNNQ
jgi:hypothetical protein